MKYVIGIALALGVFASTAIAQTRYFLFPSEVSEFSSQNARAVNLFGITTDVQTTETAGVQFLISDNSVSIPVTYQGQLPKSSKMEIPPLSWANLTEQCYLRM